MSPLVHVLSQSFCDDMSCLSIDSGTTRQSRQVRQLQRSRGNSVMGFPRMRARCSTGKLQERSIGSGGERGEREREEGG